MNKEQLLADSVADLNWFKENSYGLREEFEGNFVAIKSKKIVGFAPNVEILLGKLKRRGVNVDLVLIKHVTPKGEVVIL